MRANLPTTAARIGMAIAVGALVLAGASVVANGSGSGRIAVPIVVVMLLLLGGVLMVALPLRLASDVARLPAVRAWVTEVSFDATSHDTIEATENGMACGVAALEPHPGCTHQPHREERRFEVDEGWGGHITVGTPLVALARPRDRLLVVLGIDADVAGIED